MLKFTAISLALAITLAAPSSAASKKPTGGGGKTYKGWYIEQKLDYQGNVKVYACDAGAKIQTRTIGLYMKPGNGQSVLLNEVNRTQMPLDKSLWTNSSMIDSGLAKDVSVAILKEWKVPMKPPRMIAGHKCIQHWAAVFHANKRFWFWWEYWTPTDIKVSKEMANQWRAAMHLPAGDTIPFEAVRHFDLNRPRYKSLTFLTTQVAKPANLLASDLTPPKGYKNVSDELDIVMGANKDDDISKLFATTPGAKNPAKAK